MKQSVFLSLILLLTFSVSASMAQNVSSIPTAVEDSIMYWPTINRDSIEASITTTHPVYFKLFAPGTLYGDAVKQEVFCDETIEGDEVLVANSFINSAIVRSFVASPWLFTTTQTTLDNQSTAEPLVTETLLQPSEPIVIVDEPVAPTIDDSVVIDVVAEKPNFWKFDGTGSMHFTQNHISDNWYQGGSNNYTMLSQLKLHSIYDNKQKVQWETTLECKLGFQTVDDGPNKFRVNNDQLRLTTKFGYKASTSWFYTVQAEATTQFTKTYDGNHNVVGDFISPLRTVLSVGMDYKFEWGKFKGSAYISPVAMTWTYVDRINLAPRYGNEVDHHSRITYGPNVKIDFTWKPVDNFTWTSRMYWFSNFEYVNYEWENTFTFTFNRYISTRFFIYPRFDDSSTSYRSKHGSYFMFKEWLSLGLEYSF